MARGIHGVDPADYKTTQGHNGPLTSDGRTTDDHSQTDQMQMGAPGEGKVRNAVLGKTGASGGEPPLEEWIERKKAEQAEARARVLGQQQGERAEGGRAGQQGGPANPVGNQGNYPNAGSDY